MKSSAAAIKHCSFYLAIAARQKQKGIMSAAEAKDNNARLNTNPAKTKISDTNTHCSCRLFFNTLCIMRLNSFIRVTLAIMWEELLKDIQQGNTKALARSISLVENEVEGYQLLLQRLPATSSIYHRHYGSAGRR
jgi:hypothetical protein